MEAYMSTKKTSDSLTTERIGKLMRTYSIPCVLSLLVGALYNIVDQLFISNASYLGSYGNAANSVVFPLTVAALSVAVMMAAGSAEARPEIQAGIFRPPRKTRKGRARSR